MSSNNCFKSTITTDAYEPFMVGDKQAGEVHWLRAEDDKPLYAGLWRCEPMTFDYEFPGEETLQCLEGELDIQLESGETINVKAGDIVSFGKGIKSVWTIRQSFKKFFVIS